MNEEQEREMNRLKARPGKELFIRHRHQGTIHAVPKESSASWIATNPDRYEVLSGNPWTKKKKANTTQELAS